jgi:two-component system sensor histidine kinase CpxA
LRKLYLKIVVAIWTVMLAASIGVALVVNVVMPDARFRPQQLPWENVLASIANRASAEAHGTGKQGLIEWFERNSPRPGTETRITLIGGGRPPMAPPDGPVRRIRYLADAIPPLTLLDTRGNVLAGSTVSAGELRNVSSEVGQESGNRDIHQHEFVHDGERYRIVSRTPPRNFARTVALITMRPPSFWLLFVIAVPLSVILSFAIARYLVRPLRSIEEAGRRLSEGDFSARVGPSLGNRGDEIADFAAAFDQMAMRIETLVRAHKVLLRDVSHELRSPLARAHAALSLARQRTNGIVDNELDRMEVEIGRLDGMIGKLLAFSRLDSGERPISREPVELVGLLTEIVEDSAFEARSNDKAVQLQDLEPLTVNGDPELLASCFENVVRNAVRHTQPHTVVEISLWCDGGSSSCCHVQIRDHGDGVPDDQLRQIFEPFHRVEDGTGANSARSGIGLAIAKRAVNLHGGTVSAANASDGGLVVSVTLPMGKPGRKDAVHELCRGSLAA